MFASSVAPEGAENVLIASLVREDGLVSVYRSAPPGLPEDVARMDTLVLAGGVTELSLTSTAESV